MSRKRSYSDSAFGSRKQMIVPGDSIALNGTVTSTTGLARMTCMEALTVKDANFSVLVAGTAADTNLILGKSLAGTGAISGFCTATLTGTQTASSVIDATVTETDFAVGDDIVFARAAGTETETAIYVAPHVDYVEKFSAA